MISRPAGAKPAAHHPTGPVAGFGLRPEGITGIKRLIS